MTQKHSPLPFWIDHDHYIASGKNEEYLTVADPHASEDIDPSEIEANAEFIVRACNSHYDLIEALKECQKVLFEYIFDDETPEMCNFAEAEANALEVIRKVAAGGVYE